MAMSTAMQNLSISPSDFNLPGYRFDRFIGKGSYATVYKARALNEDFGVYAIKVIERASLVKHDVDNLMNEIGILKTLKHPNIVKMKDFHWDTKYVYIVTEFCEGGDLSVFIKKRQRLPEKVCLKFLRQLATGLHYLRSNNISHFDLKPKNLLLKMKPVVTLKIADFGFAQCISEEMKQFVMKGSPLYMAPEMLQCKPCDAKVDLWSVGVIYYECLYGQPPFANYSFDELTVMFTDKTVVKIPVDPAVSPKSRQLLACLLECNAARRIDFDVFFAHPLIEVAHAASPRTYAHGVRLAAEAVRLDQLRRLPEAVDLYIDALSYLVPHVKRDLSVFIKKTTAATGESLSEVPQTIGHGLHYLRHNNISHFDLKPKNLLLKMKPVVTLKIADFGFAQCISEEMKQFVMKGSPLYMAPEMLQCKPCDAKVDLWSVGVIYYECLYGQPPLLITPSTS
ncbi:hypothetical protein LSTR_LSTR008227 [Laodelphax striatellus]|uniref:non-specific serine/threonine protein kinase n=1 Tax=Laodelphax striatellus TaxID=195883 RepID=A0A482WUG9_LAOST|nr:hypothetical protein LSTR_LSTR008227 [Laodelphax striatellus]